MSDLPTRLRGEANASEELHPGDSEIETMREAATLIERLMDALTEAKRTIMALHGKTAWDIYDAHSPEMKKINAALNSAI